MKQLCTNHGMMIVFAIFEENEWNENYNLPSKNAGF